jgi:O-antigen ligase
METNTLGLIVAFAALARGAHDLWSATLIYAVVIPLFLFVAARKGLRHVSLWPVGLLFGVFVVSAVGGINISESIWELTDWSAALLLFLLAANAFQNDDRIDGFLHGVAGALWVQPFLILLQKYQMGPATYFSDDAPGTLVNAAVGAGFMLFWVPVFFAKTRETWSTDRFHAWFWLSALAACLVSIVLYASTGGAICVIAAALAYAARRRPKQALAALGAFILVAAALIAVKHAEVFSHQPQTSRVLWWQSAWGMFRDHPLFGIGLGNYPSAYLAYKVGAGQNTLYPHSIVFGFLAETGAVGLMSLMVALGALAWQWVKYVAPARRPFAAGVFLFLAYGLISVGIEYFVNLLTLWIFIGIALAPSAQKLWQPRRTTTIVMAGVGAVVLVYLVSFFVSSQRLVAGEPVAAAKLNPLSWEAEQAIAQSAYAAGNPESAAMHQRNAIGLNRLNGRLYWELGHYLKEEGRLGEAREAFLRAIELNKSNARFRMDLDELNAS